MTTILIVDDRPVNRQFLATLLSYAGHQVVEAADGLEALDVVARHRPELAIVDIMMPKMDGVEFVRQMRAEGTLDPEVVFYTATYRNSEARQFADSVGVRHVLQKPAPPQEILQLVDSLLSPQKTSPERNSAGERSPVSAAGGSLIVSDAVLESEYLNTRMVALLELSLELADAGTPDAMLTMACGAARRIVEASFTAIGQAADDETQFEFFVTDGCSAAGTPVEPPANPGTGWFGHTLDRPRRHAPAFIAEMPEIKSVLAVPIPSSTKQPAWMYFFDRIDGSGFSLDDERLAQTIASHVGTLLENFRVVNTLERTARDLRRSNEDLRRFAARVSHDLQAPLRGMKTLLKWIDQDVGHQLPNEQREQFTMTVSCAERMQLLIEDLLEYSSLGARKLSTELVDLEKLISNTVELLSLPSEFVVAIDVPLPPLLTGRTPLELILRNLISNAVKHHDRAKGRIQITGKDMGPVLEFSVEDDGPGIDLQYHTRVFAEFETLDEQGGSGLGLSMVKRAVESCGGTVHLASNGRGTKVSFTWPKQWMPPTAPGHRVSLANSLKPRGSTPTSERQCAK